MTFTDGAWYLEAAVSDPQIGQWVRRPPPGNWHVNRGKWHVVESVVAGDAVTRCGKRMDRVASFARRKERAARFGELQVSEVMPLTRMIGQPQLCKAGCERQAVDEADAVAAGALDHGNEADYVDLPRPEDDGSTQPEMVP